MAKRKVSKTESHRSESDRTESVVSPSSDSKEETSVPNTDIVEHEPDEDIDDIIPTNGYKMETMIALGGSAGSIPALQTFFHAMPADSGFIYVVIIHLSADHESHLAEVIQQSTSMPVVQVMERVAVQPNWIYVIPPGKILACVDGHLELADREIRRGGRMAIDYFFRTMADTYGPHSAAIVLSGTDGDGAMGIKRIKERGGLTIAQDPNEAEYKEMPRSAIASGMVDWVLNVFEIPRRLITYQQIASRLMIPTEDGPLPVVARRPLSKETEAELRDILSYLQTRTGRDFSCYKRATILRRIARRLQVNELDNLPDYLSYMRTHPGEAGALLKDLLISVTNFFRDREAFRELEEQIPKLFKGKGPNDSVRVWVAGCATGEEAYSIAIMLNEYVKTLEAPPVYQVFATDLDDDVIRQAREGLFPDTITADVTDERLRRYFIKEHHGYRVRREIRESILFAVHDLLIDSPFSRLDLISCRNLLIYLNREAQGRAHNIFHFALNPYGILFLGSSESIDDKSSLFTTVDKKNRIYVRQNSGRPAPPIQSGHSSLFLTTRNQANVAHVPVISSLTKHAGNLVSGLRTDPKGEMTISWADAHFRLIERFGPPSLIVNAQFDILHLSEHVGRFLHFEGGEPTRNLLQLVHPMLRIELRGALYSTAQTQQPTHVTAAAELEGKPVEVSITVLPAGEIVDGGMLVTFETRPDETDGVNQKLIKQGTEPAARQLERELERIKSQLSDTIEQYEVTTEELKAGNEELQAMNEELRSATEELETGREELQSTNEELVTVNQELKSKVDELGTANSDLHNLMGSTAIATIFLDRELCIKRFTPRALEIFPLNASDIGRPLHDLTHRLNYPELLEDASKVLLTLIPVERKVGDVEGRSFLGRILPYRTIEDRIAGVVMTFIDVSQQSRAEQAALESAAEFRSIFELSSIGLAEADPQSGQILRANRKLGTILGLSLEELQTNRFGELFNTDDSTEVSVAGRNPFNQLLVGQIPEYTLEKRLQIKDGQLIWVRCTISMIRDHEGRARSALAAVIDITRKRKSEDALRQSQEQLKESNAALDERVRERTQELEASEVKLREIADTSDRRADELQSLATELTSAEHKERRRIAVVLHDHIQQILIAARMRADLIKGATDPEFLRQQADQVIGMIDEAINATRTLSVELVPPLLHDDGLPAALEWLGERMLEQHMLNVVVEAKTNGEWLSTEFRDILFDSTRELLLNVVKHSKTSEAVITLSQVDHEIVLEASDRGIGFTPGPKSTRNSFGLFQIRERVKAAGGTFKLESAPGAGTRVTIRLPYVKSAEHT